MVSLINIHFNCFNLIIELYNTFNLQNDNSKYLYIIQYTQINAFFIIILL